MNCRPGSLASREHLFMETDGIDLSHSYTQGCTSEY